MKKLFTLLVLVSAFAFTGATQVRALTKSATTLVAPTSATAATAVIGAYYGSISLTVHLVKNTGTLAGTAVVQVSLNGTDWSQVQSTTLTDVATTDITFKDVPAAYRYYRVLVTTTGTSNVTMSGSYEPKGRR